MQHGQERRGGDELSRHRLGGVFGLPHVGQELLQLAGRRAANLRQHAGQVPLRIHAVTGATGDQAPQPRVVGRRLVIAGKEPILPIMLSSALAELCEVQDYAVTSELLRNLKGSPWTVEMSCQQIHYYQEGTAHDDCTGPGQWREVLGSYQD